MLNLYTFCVFINRISKNDLLYALNLLLKSLDIYVKDYKLIIYTNFDLSTINNKSIEIRNYYNHCKNNTLYDNDIWKKLSLNKLFVYKDLYDEFNLDFMWIDLDTYIYYDISYINDVSNIFLEYGGEYKRLEKITSNFSLEYHKNIQGNLWKINIDLYNKLIELSDSLISRNIHLEFDTQSLFSYYIYVTLNGDICKNNINILGNNYKNNTINGLSIWCEKNNAMHANLYGLNNLYIEDNVLKSKYHNDKEIHIVSFTFYTLNFIKNNVYFKKIF
jgi:hypothetical protein